jgi:hypothetical protein
MLPPMVTCLGGQGSPRELHLSDVEGRPQPRHVHVYRDGKLVLKWNLDAHVPMKGTPTARLVRLIKELDKEGAL